MLRLAYKTGAKLHVMNKQNLTPLTLAARMAKKTVCSSFNENFSKVANTDYEMSSKSKPTNFGEMVHLKDSSLKPRQYCNDILACLWYQSWKKLDTHQGL